MSLGLGEEDWLWTSPITFVASANCGLYCGAKVDFVDIDPDTYNICPQALEKKLIQAKKTGSLPKVVIPVHLGGHSCDMKSIFALSNEYGFKIIEDASHAVGGRYLNKPIGSCEYSDISIFSFHPVKIITTGEGGMALTNNSKLAQAMSRLRTHGITRNIDEMTKEPDGAWYYQQIELGYNYRMTDIQAALGISQFKRLDEMVSRRHVLAEQYNKLLNNLPLKLPYQDSNGYSSYHLYIIRLEDASKHKKTFNNLRAKKIGVNIHYIPVYRHPFHSKNKSDAYNFPNSELYYSTAMSIPLYPAMSDQDQLKVVKAIEKSL
jgi:UDP-4-amino-4,6-dideoxy-N-acetyl-beta-L-altrosamine transaminase